MKTRTLITALGTLALLSACASTPTETHSGHLVNHAYVDTVDRHATRTGARVYWVNPPKRKSREEEQNGF
jgi:hypothetical protein